MTDHWFDKHIKDLLRNYKSRVPTGLWNRVSLEVKNELFDEHVKDALTAHESNVPKGLWDKIEAEQKKERRPIAWWQNAGVLTGIAALLLLSIGGYYWLHDTKETATAITARNTNSNYTKQGKESSAPSATTTNSNSNNLNKEEMSAATTAAQGSASSSAGQSLAGKSLTTGNNNRSPLNTSLSLPASKKHRTHTTSGQQTSDNSGNDIAAAQNDITTTTTAQQTTGDAVDQLRKEDKSKQLVASEVYTPVLQQQVVTPFDQLSNNHLTSIQRLKGANSFSLSCPNTIRPTWFLEVYGSPDYTMQRVHATSASNVYLKRKDSTETMEGGFTIGARIARTINDHWMVKSGLQYTQVNQRFSVRTENEIKTTTVITTRAVVRNPGDTVFVSDTSALTQIGYRLRTTQNRFRSLEIPLIASYETGNNNWRLGISGGVIINATSWYSGEILDTSYNIVPLSAKSANGVYRSAINLSAYLGVSVARRITNDIEIFAEPYFRYGLSSSSISNLGYSQSFNAAGLSLGIRYQLNNKGSKYSR